MHAESNVYLGSRNLQKGLEAIEKLKSEGFTNVEAIQIDVTDDNSVKTAREEIGKKTNVLDALINNAAITGVGFDNNGFFLPQTATHTTVDVYKEVFDTNLYGVIRVTQAFLDLLKNSPEPRIVNVTSGMGSLSLQSDPTWKYYHYKLVVYQTSKSALNMYTITLAYELRDTAFKVNAVSPPYTKTDLNNNQGTASVEEAAEQIIKYVLIDNDGPTGKFFSKEGELTW